MRVRSLSISARPASLSGARSELYIVPGSIGSKKTTSPKLYRVKICFQNSTAPSTPDGGGKTASSNSAHAGVTKKSASRTSAGKILRIGKFKTKLPEYRKFDRS